MVCALIRYLSGATTGTATVRSRFLTSSASIQSLGWRRQCSAQGRVVLSGKYTYETKRYYATRLSGATCLTAFQYAFSERLSRVLWRRERTLLLAGQIIIGFGNIGFFLIFGGCDGLFGVSGGSATDSSASAGEQLLMGQGQGFGWLPDDYGAAAAAAAGGGGEYPVEWAGNVSSSSSAAAFLGGADYGSADAAAEKGKVPVWVVVLVGSWWTFGGSMQVRTHSHTEHTSRARTEHRQSTRDHPHTGKI